MFWKAPEVLANVPGRGISSLRRLDRPSGDAVCWGERLLAPWHTWSQGACPSFFFFVSLYSILGRRHASRSVPERRLWWSLLVVDDWIRRSFLPSGLAYACFTGETSSALYLFNSHLEFIYLICFMFYTVYIVLHCFICVTPVCVTLFFFLFCFYLALFF